MTNKELKQRYANAYTTYCMAGGHATAELNKIKMLEYEKEMTERGLNIPNEDELEGKGVFGGEGSV